MTGRMTKVPEGLIGPVDGEEPYFPVNKSIRLSKTGDDLRALVSEIERVCAASMANSIAHPIVRNACDHLCAISRIHDFNNRDFEG